MEKIYYNGNEYELATKTMKVAKLQERAETSATMMEAYTNEFEFVKAVIGDEAVKDILGTNRLDEIDLNQMVMLYNEIVTAYDKEIREAERERVLELISNSELDKIGELAKTVEVMSKIDEIGKAKKK